MVSGMRTLVLTWVTNSLLIMILVEAMVLAQTKSTNTQPLYLMMQMILK